MNRGHEEKDADVPGLFLIAVTLFASSAVIMLCTWWLMRFLALKETAREKPPPLAPTMGAFPPPRLQVRAPEELQKLRASEDARLNSYGWVDRSRGIARVPVDRAMQLLVEHGLEDIGGNQTPLLLMQARPQQNEPPRAEPRP